MKMTVLHGHPGQNGVNVHLPVEEEPVLEKENVDYQMALKYLMGNVQMVSTKSQIREQMSGPGIS